jgi:hypothetical protein
VFRKSKLEKSLTAWLRKSGSLQTELSRDGDRVSSEAEARLVCAALDKALSARPIQKYTEGSYNLNSAVALFQNTDSDSATALLRAQGLPRLRVLVESYLSNRDLDPDAVVFVAKILAMYGEPQDVDLIINLARDADCEDRYLWSVIFDVLASHGSIAERVIDGLRRPLPTKFCGIAFLDLCNRMAISGTAAKHAFESPEGYSRLRELLSSNKDAESSYAISATAALPFISHEVSAELMEMAGAHPEVAVRIENAWAQGKMGREPALAQLAEYARNPLYASRAIRYLEELGHAERIPEEARTADAKALAEMAEWLAHPNELGAPPEEVFIADTRELFWPPTNDRRQLWIIGYKYRSEDEPLEDYGLVGSTTWAMFSEPRVSKPIEIYAVHCCWELQANDDPRAPSERSVAAGLRILAENNPEFRLR